MSDSLKAGLQAKANSLVPVDGKKKEPQTIKDWIQASQKQIEKALPGFMSMERFCRIAITAVNSNPKLALCTPISFMGSLMQAAQLGLEPNTPLGHAYLIPYKIKGELQAQFQMGYKGLIDLCNRTGEFKRISSDIIFENDYFDVTMGIEDSVTYKPYAMVISFSLDYFRNKEYDLEVIKRIKQAKDKGKALWIFSKYNLKNGGYGFNVMSINDCKLHGQRYSKSFSDSYSPWQTSPESMYMKTSLKQCLKFAPMSVEMQRQLSTDETISTSLNENMFESDKVNIFNTIEGEFTSEEIPEEKATITPGPVTPPVIPATPVTPVEEEKKTRTYKKRETVKEEEKPIVKEEIPQQIQEEKPPHVVSQRAIDLIKASTEFSGNPDLKAYIKANYNTESGIEFKNYFYNQATDEQIANYDVFLTSLKLKKLGQLREEFNSLNAKLKMNSEEYFSFSREVLGKKKIDKIEELSIFEMERVNEALKDKLSVEEEKRGDKITDDFFQSMTEEQSKVINDANRKLAEEGKVGF